MKVTAVLEKGVLGRSGLEKAIEEKWVAVVPPAELELGPSAVDLPLGRDYWVMPGSVRPEPGQERSVEDLLTNLGKRAEAGGPVTLKKNSVHVFRLALTLDLPTIATGRATGKSSVGRLDVLTRLLCDGGQTFDEIPAGYTGPLYVEVVPNSFDIIVDPTKPKCALNQLRLFWGEPRESKLRLRDALALSPRGRVLYGHAPFHGEHLESDLASLRVNLQPEGRAWAAFSPKGSAPEPVNITKEANSYSGSAFWEAIPTDSASGQPYVRLEPDRFYILASKERFTLPRNLCVECRAYQETLGEYRIHYAGFVHPEFGSGQPRGTPLILEVRPHSANALLFGHEPVASVEFYRMQEPTEGESSYSGQELTLSKYFKDDF